MLSVCMCARFQSDPRECHLVAVKRILRYLVATSCFGIWYPKGSTFDLIGYSDSDYAGIQWLCNRLFRCLGHLDVIKYLSAIYFEHCVMMSNYVIAVYVSF
jgi:hypothetical protein